MNDEAGKLKESPGNHSVWVQCEGFRCLAYLDGDGKWRNWINGEKLPNVIKILDSSPDSNSPTT